jgi:SPP1 family predicted phage head-tail adaptor
MIAGELRDRVEILKLADGALGSRGQRVQLFGVLERRWAQFEYLSGVELERARQVHAQTTARVTIRTPNYAIDTEYRVKFRGKTYGVGAVIPIFDTFHVLQILLSEVS